MMTTTQPLQDAINQDLATIRALSSITSQQADTIAQTVQASGRAWDVQTFEDYDGYLSILIEPSVRDDEQKTFFISGTAQHLDLFEGYGDDMILLGYLQRRRGALGTTAAPHRSAVISAAPLRPRSHGSIFDNDAQNAPR